MPAPNNPPDWNAIERAYRANLQSVRAIASRHGASEATIRWRAKKYGWTRGLEQPGRDPVMAGVAEELIRQIEEAAQDAVDLERGLRIYRHCLMALEVAAANLSDPKEVKQVVDAARAAMESIRRIRGIDDEPQEGEASDDDTLADAIARRLEAAHALAAG